MKRLMVPELLDSDRGTPQEVSDSLADLRMFNRRFGGVRTMSTLLRQVAERRHLTELDWLDVAGGTGDVATLTAESLRNSGLIVRPVVLDRAATHLNSSHLNVCADALALPFRDATFDVIGSSLFVHHLLPDELRRFVQEALRVARHAFVVNDLIRSPVHYAVALAGRAIYRSRLTRHDAPASVRAAYTVEEVLAILKESRATAVSLQTFYFYRMGVIAWKKAEASTT
jgi:SAM-dependent methyltransferase